MTIGMRIFKGEKPFHDGLDLSDSDGAIAGLGRRNEVEPGREASYPEGKEAKGNQIPATHRRVGSPVEITECRELERTT